jgi:hypothetical protein
VTIPELQGDGLTIDIAQYDGFEYWACLKIGAAAPASAGTSQWKTAGYCELFHFTNETGTPTPQESAPVKRAVLRVPENLRGVGSHSGAVAADSVLVDSVHANAHARRNIAASARGSAVLNVRAGFYYLTVHSVTSRPANTTLHLKLSGKSCPKVGQYGPACAALQPVTDGVSFPFNNVDASGIAAARFADSNAINDTTAVAQRSPRRSTPPTAASPLLARCRRRAHRRPSTTRSIRGQRQDGADDRHRHAAGAARRATGTLRCVNTNNKTAVNANITVSLTQCGAGLRLASAATRTDERSRQAPAS